MRLFTESDVHDSRIYVDRYRSELIWNPPKWMERGFQETASGYGKRLNSGWMINFEGRKYRIYVTIYSNSGSSWFKSKGRKIYVD